MLKTIQSKRVNLLFIIVLAVICVFLLGKAFAAQPGSASDPIVTQSYLVQNYSWQLTTLSPGESFPLTLGAEVILRSGEAALSGRRSQGVADLTIGHNLPVGTLIPSNHLLIYPSLRGSRIKAITPTILLTKGAEQ
ncbi:MAG: hypothetical protein M1421_06925 [Candidatus Eremiobacteraeota bacterium]|nr:hypothetical protein [Candidatus Eremiobacteraeota bacterium]MCL5055099.1 hypothetical protein [Bacillota bacterium]